MKKVLALFIIFILFLSMTLVSAVQLKVKDGNVLYTNGSFSGYIGILKQQDPIILGNISGIYKFNNLGGAFNATWDINYKNQSSSGIVRGFFKKHILLGKLSLEGFNKTLPIIGFIGFNKENLTFKGRAMSYIGPALYFWGVYEPY